MPNFKRVPLAEANWKTVWASFPDRTIFQSAEWLAFLAESQRFEPVLAALMDGNDVLGYLTGILTRKAGFKILASPMPGSSTPYMGFNLRPDIPRRVAVEALTPFAFQELRCAYLEVVDPQLTATDIAGLGFQHGLNATLEIDLTQSEDQLFNGMTKSCRWTVRKGERNGVIIEETTDLGIAEEFADQLKDVFAKKGMLPHYGADRVRSLIRHLQPTGNLLSVRARDPQGNCIASGLFPAANTTAYYLGGASWRQYQKLYPNEVLQWYVIRYWKRRGMRTYNMVGNMKFKQKFGGRETAALCISKSKNKLIAALRKFGPDIMRAGLRVAWRVKTIGRKRALEEKAPAD